jgi:hypothetical protein
VKIVVFEGKEQIAIKNGVKPEIKSDEVTFLEK